VQEAIGNRLGEPTENRLYVLWTSGDRDVALKMAFMYTFNAKVRGWWKEVSLIVWGPSAPLLAGDLELQNKIDEMKHIGVELLACRACSDAYGVSDKLRELGIDVKSMGLPLTEVLKEGYRVLTV
jgi:hypothetical protein